MDKWDFNRKSVMCNTSSQRPVSTTTSLMKLLHSTDRSRSGQTAQDHSGTNTFLILSILVFSTE